MTDIIAHKEKLTFHVPVDWETGEVMEVSEKEFRQWMLVMDSVYPKFEENFGTALIVGTPVELDPTGYNDYKRLFYQRD